MHTFSLLKPSFIPKLKNSCMALLGMNRAQPIVSPEKTELIRDLMLGELGEFGEKKFPAVVRRVRYAPDVQGLWYARSDVMAILAATHGETLAREKMTSISRRFDGMLPASLTSKSSFKSRH